MHAALVIFDCDGVLVDSERISHSVLHAMLLEMGSTTSMEETITRFMGASMPTCIARIADLLQGPVPEDFQPRFAARTREAFSSSLVEIPGIRSVLRSLASPYCVASNGNRAKVDFTLGHTQLLHLFEGRIFTAEQVSRPKPAPDLFLFAARSLSADPADTVVVEDSPAGIVAAKAAGMRAIGFAAMTSSADLFEAGADQVVVDTKALGSALRVHA